MPREAKGTWLPHVVWLEGVLDYFNFNHTSKSNDRVRIGYEIGQYIVGMYLAEMIIKCALHQVGREYGNIHSLVDLFGLLPEDKRADAELKYQEFMTGEVPEAWDYEASIQSYLTYLGDDPFTDIRYFWERPRPYNISIIFGYSSLRRLILALFVGLHHYPERGSYEQRFETRFRSLKESLDERQRRRASEPPPGKNRDGKIIKLDKHWLGGLLCYFNVRVPYGADDPRFLGFGVGRRIIGLYLVEVLLKYGIDDTDRQFSHSHNLASLFNRLPPSIRQAVERKYDEVLPQYTTETWDYCRSLKSLLHYLGCYPIVSTRYWWEDHDGPVASLSADPLKPLIYAILVELHGYPDFERTDSGRGVTFLSSDDFADAIVNRSTGVATLGKRKWRVRSMKL